MDALKVGGDARTMAVDDVRGRVVKLAFDALGCRVVQLALEVVDRLTASGLAMELRGQVRQAIGSAHANYVVQKVVETQPTAVAGFIAEELRGSSVDVTRHRYGCRILCRLLEHSASDQGTVALVDELLSEAGALCRHAFGHHVVKAILEHGLPAHRRQIAAALCESPLRNALNCSASCVMEKALLYCSAEDQRVLVNALLANGGADAVVSLTEDRFGHYVMEALLESSGREKVLACLKLATIRLQATKRGQELLQQEGLDPATVPGATACVATTGMILAVPATVAAVAA